MAEYPEEPWTERDKTPRHIPWNPTGWIKHSWHRKKWVPPELRREDAWTKRKLERDPNHPRFSQRYGRLVWHDIKINIIGTDPEGRRVLSIRKGNGEPIYIRATTNRIELYRAGRKVDWDNT